MKTKENTGNRTKSETNQCYFFKEKQGMLDITNNKMFSGRMGKHKVSQHVKYDGYIKIPINCENKQTLLQKIKAKEITVLTG
jgi:hypothetical protein